MGGGVEGGAPMTSPEPRCARLDEACRFADELKDLLDKYDFIAINPAMLILTPRRKMRKLPYVEDAVRYSIEVHWAWDNEPINKKANTVRHYSTEVIQPLVPPKEARA
jgi:hypothetical protein